MSLKPGKDIGSAVQTVKGQPTGEFAAGDVDVCQWRYTNDQRRFDANMPLRLLQHHWQ